MYTVDYAFDADRNVLVVRTRGALPTSEWAGISERATREGETHGCNRFLFDHREARFKLRFADLWSLPRNAGRFRLPDGARIALVIGHPLGKEKDFIEAFNRNRGFDLKVFDNEEAAVFWLSRFLQDRNPLEFSR